MIDQYSTGTLPPSLFVRLLAFVLCNPPHTHTPLLRVRLHIIGNVRIKNVGKYQACMVSQLPIICTQTVSNGCNSVQEHVRSQATHETTETRGTQGRTCTGLLRAGAQSSLVLSSAPARSTSATSRGPDAATVGLRSTAVGNSPCSLGLLDTAARGLGTSPFCYLS